MRTFPLIAASAAALLLTMAAPARAAEYVVPVDVGIGPAAYVISGPVAEDRVAHYGVQINLEAVIDKQWIRDNPRAVPRKYRDQVKQVEEIRFSPSIFIPDALFISPAQPPAEDEDDPPAPDEEERTGTGIYGVTWRPIGINLGFGPRYARLRTGAGLLFTYFYLHSDVLDDTHFARPGIDLRAELELAFGRHFLVSGGWSSGFYVPQELGGFGVGEDPLEDSIWHVGQAFVQLHVRFPYRYRQ